MSTDRAKQAIDLVQHCTDMLDVRRNVDALDDVLVPLLVTRMGYMQQAARIKAEATERQGRATDNQARVMAEKSSELRAAAMRRTDKSMRLQRVEEHKRYLMQQRVEEKHARLAAIKAQQATLGRRRERAMHVLFLKEQKEAMAARGSGATSAPPA